MPRAGSARNQQLKSGKKEKLKSKEKTEMLRSVGKQPGESAESVLGGEGGYGGKGLQKRKVLSLE